MRESRPQGNTAPPSVRDAPRCGEAPRPALPRSRSGCREYMFPIVLTRLLKCFCTRNVSLRSSAVVIGPLGKYDTKSPCTLCTPIFFKTTFVVCDVRQMQDGEKTSGQDKSPIVRLRLLLVEIKNYPLQRNLQENVTLLLQCFLRFTAFKDGAVNEVKGHVASKEICLWRLCIGRHAAPLWNKGRRSVLCHLQAQHLYAVSVMLTDLISSVYA